MNCKEGDLAIVVKGFSGANSPHVGKIVLVVSMHLIKSYLGTIWNIEFSRPVLGMATTSKGRFLGINPSSTKFHCPDDWLRPLPGELVDTETETHAPRKEPVPA